MMQAWGKLLDFVSFKNKKAGEKYCDMKAIEQILLLSEFKREKYHYTNMFNIKIYKYNDELFTETSKEKDLITHLGTKDWKTCVAKLVRGEYVPNNIYLNFVLGYSDILHDILCKQDKQNDQIKRAKSDKQKEGNMARLKKLKDREKTIRDAMSEDLYTKERTWQKIVKYFEYKYMFTTQAPEDIFRGNRGITNKTVYNMTLTNIIKKGK